MPILRLNRIPYYITISELFNLSLVDRFIMYENKDLRNKPLEYEDKVKIAQYVINNRKNDDNGDYRHEFIRLTGRDARCACSELILYHLYFYGKNISIYGYDTYSDATSNKVILNDLYFPYETWNVKTIQTELEIKSGKVSHSIRLSNIVSVVGFFEHFKIILKDVIITIAGGEISFEPWRQFNETDIFKFHTYWKENSSFLKKINSIDKRNYADFAFYLNDNFLYIENSENLYYDPQKVLYGDFEHYKNLNSDLFK